MVFVNLIRKYSVNPYRNAVISVCYGTFKAKASKSIFTISS